MTRLFATTLAAAALLAGTASAQTIVLGGNPPGSLFHSMSSALAKVVSDHSGMKVDVLPQGGSSYYPMMATEEVDMGVVNPIDALSAAMGQEPYDKASGGKGFPMRTVMLGSPIRLSMVVTKDSGIKTLADLKGKRVVANYGAFNSSGLTAEAALANAGLSTKDVTVITVTSYPEGIRAMMEGRADSAVASLGSGIVQELDAAKGAVILSLDPSKEAMARAKKFGEAYVAMPTKKGQFPGVQEDIQALSYAITVVARTNLQDDRVTKFIDAVWNNHKQLQEIFKPMASWTPNRFVSTEAVLAYHPAAIAYYKSKGVWTEEMEKHQQALLAKVKN